METATKYCRTGKNLIGHRSIRFGFFFRTLFSFYNLLNYYNLKTRANGTLDEAKNCNT